jgi:hypothetical protein
MNVRLENQGWQPTAQATDCNQLQPKKATAVASLDQFQLRLR